MGRTNKSIKANCDRIYSQLIKSKGFCTRCGNRNIMELDPHHIFSRRHGSIRFDEENGICLDRKCHRWAHDNREEFLKWVGTFRNIAKLEKKKELLSKRDTADWLELEEELNMKYEKAYEGRGW